VLDDNPEILLVKVPVPVPFVVLLLAVVGFCDLLQHTPLAVIGPPPSEEMLPPEIAVVEVIEPAEVVVRVAKRTGFEEKETSLP
jgi:hypothetical protein